MMKRYRRRFASMVAVTTLVVGLGACTDDDDDPADERASAATDTTARGRADAELALPPADAVGASGATFSIEEFAFLPTAVAVKAGTEVTFKNRDSTDHTATADDGSFDSQPIAEGGSFTHTFEAPGTFAFHCAIHNSMTGTVTVS